MTKEWGPGQVTPRALGPLHLLPPSFSGLLQVMMVCLKPSHREAFIEHPLDTSPVLGTWDMGTASLVFTRDKQERPQAILTH